MKLFFIWLFFIVSFSAQGYSYNLNSLDNAIDSFDRDRQLDELRDMQRKQACILNQQQEQLEYTACLLKCQKNRELFGSSYLGCFCSKPFSIGCF